MRRIFTGRNAARIGSIAFVVIAAAIDLFVPGSLLNPSSSGIAAHSVVAARLNAAGVCSLMVKTGIVAFLGKSSVDPSYGGLRGCTIEAPDCSAVVLQLYPGTAAAVSLMYYEDNIEAHRNIGPGNGQTTNPAVMGTGGATVFYAPGSWSPTTVIAEWVATGYGYDGQISVDYTSAYRPPPIAQIIYEINNALVQSPASPITRPAPVAGAGPGPVLQTLSLRQWNGSNT